MAKRKTNTTIKKQPVQKPVVKPIISKAEPKVILSKKVRVRFLISGVGSGLGYFKGDEALLSKDVANRLEKADVVKIL